MGNTFDANWLLNKRFRINLLVPNVTVSGGENDYTIRGYNEMGIFVTRQSSSRLHYFPWTSFYLESIDEVPLKAAG